MDAPDLVRRTPDALLFANRDEIISRYKRSRMGGLNLNTILTARLSKDVLEEGGRKLGIFQKGMFVFDTQDDVCILNDYCIYDVRRNGRNAIEQYLIDSPPDPESELMACLRAMQRAFYSPFVVESVEPGLGVVVRDLFSAKISFVVDMGLGMSAQPNLVLAARVLPHDEFLKTSGAAIPVAVLTAAQVDALADKLTMEPKPDADGYFDPASLIRTLLRAGCSSRIQYVDSSDVAPMPPRLPSSNPISAVGRNSPCPCGSGKKFKRCCVDRR